MNKLTKRKYKKRLYKSLRRKNGKDLEFNDIIQEMSFSGISDEDVDIVIKEVTNKVFSKLANLSQCTQHTINVPDHSKIFKGVNKIA